MRWAFIDGNWNSVNWKLTQEQVYTAREDGSIKLTVYTWCHHRTADDYTLYFYRPLLEPAPNDTMLAVLEILQRKYVSERSVG